MYKRQLLEQPTGGKIFYHGQDIENAQTNKYRAKVGMVFQQFNLFNNMTVLENCVVGQRKVLKRSRKEAEQKAIMYLEKVGMGDYIDAKPTQISGGQKQRVAIALSLIHIFITTSRHRADIPLRRLFQEISS